MARLRLLRDERGAAPVEFILVGALLTFLTLAILQLALGLYVRNVVHDAAVSGAFHAALADTSLADGEVKVYRVVEAAVAPDVVQSVVVTESEGTISVVVRATLPLLGFWGVDQMMEVTAHAPVETLDR